ncbi:hypothetical protein [Puerhibacterium sp. TATVAM-FAB25]|uniref:hypothetical protein n=1 Tax=Puerhibacterium sp. TATVAM-FAB25 TaxID=3093699 RepID=UPI00397E494D
MTDDARTGRPDEPGEVTLDAAASLRLIREQQERARAATEPDGRALYAAWGVAWLAGYLCLWSSSRRTADGAAGASGQPEPWAFAVFGGAILAAVAFTIVHTVTRTAGTRGASARTGALYGWAWFLGFLAIAFIQGGLARAGASPEVMGLASNATACLVVGLLYLAGGMVFGETRLYVLGVWILLVAAVASFVGIPLTYLVMALAGGGGFLLLAALEQVLRSRRRRAGRAAVPSVAAGDGPSRA